MMKKALKKDLHSSLQRLDQIQSTVSVFMIIAVITGLAIAHRYSLLDARSGVFLLVVFYLILMIVLKVWSTLYLKSIGSQCSVEEEVLELVFEALMISLWGSCLIFALTTRHHSHIDRAELGAVAMLLTLIYLIQIFSYF